MALHAEQGVLRTSWEDVADRAGVSVVTVYRHFPTLAELVPACARSVFDLIQPLTVEEAAAQFGLLEGAGARFEHLVRESCRCYAKGEGWLHAAYRERDFVPELASALEVIESSLRALVEAAAGRRLGRVDRAVLFSLCNFPFWKSLVDEGIARRRIEDVIVGLVHAELARMALGPDRGKEGP